MAITTVDLATSFIRGTNTLVTEAQLAQLDSIVPGACAAVENYCKRKLETATYTDYLHGNGQQMLLTRQRPVQLTSLTGTLSNGSAVVTALSSTTLLAAGMSVSGSGIPAGTTVSSVDSAMQVTLSDEATSTGSSALAFGPAVWLDSSGFAGRGSNAFPAAGLLREGFDWLLDYGPDGNLTSKSGNLIRLGGGVGGTTLDAVWPWQWRQGTLTARAAPTWPPGLRNVKVTYRAGYGLNPAAEGGTLPEDLTLAANLLVAYILRTARLGGPIQSESMGQYSYSLQPIIPHSLNDAPELGSARQLLSRYREVVL